MPLWSRSWHMQEINKAKISMSLVGRQRGEGAQPLPHAQSKNGCVGCPGATGQELGTPGSPSWKAALVWSLTGSLLQGRVTVSRSHPEDGAMQPSSWHC